jgi:nicotinate-nucleotide pyrophosphorylase (carboxylating)
MEKPERESYLDLILKAKAEDFGGGDVTSRAVIASASQGSGFLVFREAGVVCGLALVCDILNEYGALAWKSDRADGEFVAAGECVGVIEGSLRSLLAAERLVLNFLGHLSGIATQTARYVAEVLDSDAQIYDTRKTTPGWRVLEKYAVRCGGGANHRMGLYDAVLIKDNHLAAMSGGDWLDKLSQAVAAARGQNPVPKFIEVEVDTLEQLQGVLAIEGVDRILLDNMDCELMRQAVALRGERSVLLEASGGMALEKVGDVGRCGVDIISVGALTHSSPSLDIGLDLSLKQSGG